MVVEDVAESGLESASIVKPPVDCSSTRTRILWSMLHGSSILASRREERVQKAALVDHHGPGDARLSHSAIGLFREQSDYVPLTDPSMWPGPPTVQEYLSKKCRFGNARERP